MHRFFSPTSLTNTLELIEGKIFHQIAHVFRSKKGDKFIFFEMDGPDTVYEVKEAGKKEIILVQIKIQEAQKSNTGITVIQAFPNKIQTMEMVVQKLVEIGVEKIIFFRADRSQIGEISAQKRERIETIATEALEQSGNNHFPEIIYSQKGIHELLENNSGAHIVGSPDGENIFVSKKGEKKHLWIGPEGGWSEHEIVLFKEAGCTLWSFAESILRLETASILGAGILNYLSGI